MSSPTEAPAALAAPGRPTVEGTLRGRAVSASVWAIVGQVGSQVITLVSGIVMTRLLMPEAFGLMVIAFATLGGIQLCSELGIRVSILTNPRGSDPAFLDTAWTIQILRGLVVFVISLPAGWLLASIYDDPQLSLLIPALGITALAEGFTSTKIHTASRDLVFGRPTLIPLAGALVALVARIGVACVWPSVWAIVIGAWCSSAVVVWASHAWMPGHSNRWRVDPTARREILQIGRWIVVSMVFVFLGVQADRFIFAAMIPMAMLGVYGLSMMIASIPTDFVGRLCGSYGQPALTLSFSRTGSIDAALTFLRRPLLAVSGAAISGIIVLAPLLTGILFDERYSDSAWLTRVIAVMAWFRSLDTINCMALMALGAANLNAVSNVLKVLVMVAAIPAGAMLAGPEHEFPGALAGFLAAEFVKYATGATQTVLRGISALRLEGTASLGVALAMLAAVAPWLAPTASWLPLAAALTSLAWWVGFGAWSLRGLRRPASLG